MLLFLDESLLNQIENNDTNQSALNNIANARKLGKHVITGKPNVMKSLSENASLSQSSRDIYRKIYNDLSSEGRLIKKLSWYIKVVAEDVLEKIEQETVNIIIASIKYFEDYELLGKTKFLLEDVDDAAFYKKICEFYNKQENIENCKIDFNLSHGGGQNTNKSFDIAQNEGNCFCLCILDSDRKTPNTNIGDTAKAVQNINQNDKLFCHFEIITVREIENLIPTFIYRECFYQDVNKKPAIDFFEKMEKLLLTDYRKYMDMKEGLKLGKILKEKPKSSFRIYWESFVENALDSQIIEVDQKCLNQKQCDKYTKEDKLKKCTCYVTIGFGDKIISVINHKYKNQDFLNTSNELPEDLRLEWLRIGITITSWCCASQPLRS